MTRREWAAVERDKGLGFNEGDEIYHEDLLLGWISEIKKPWFRKAEVIMTLASREARDFLMGPQSDDLPIIQLIPNRWVRFKRWLRTSCQKVIE